MYLARRGRLRQLTADHLAPLRMAVPNGPTAADGVRIVTRPALAKYLGVDGRQSEPDVRVVTVQRGDRFVLTTDGVTSRMKRADIMGVLDRYAQPRPAARMLVARALARGTLDNVSCVVVRVV